MAIVHVLIVDSVTSVLRANKRRRHQTGPRLRRDGGARRDQRNI